MIQMQTHRFFIGDLPAGTSEKDINKAFKDHGEVTNVDLKQKENLVEPGSVKALAFVTVKLYDGDVDYCLKQLNSRQINGQYVRVSVAKESFMERLKREREETAQKSTKSEKQKPAKTDDDVPPFKKSKQFFEEDEYAEGASSNPFKPVTTDIQSSNKSKKYFDSDDDDKEQASDDEDPVLIKKKRAANSMRNGRIVIEGTNNAPIHVIGKKKDVKQLDEKSFKSDKKRKESVKKKKDQYQLQKSLIQKSLSSVDAAKTKKIVFDDNSDNESEVKTKALFDDGSDQEDESFGNEFALKAEYEGARGEELMKLQSKMSLDPRFKVDHKFVDDIEEEPPTNENSERDWQYGILEQVTGSKVLSSSHSKANEKKMLKMVRYDPSKDNQDKLLRKSKKDEPQEEEVDDADEEVADKPEVSKEVFYVVSENLTNSLKTRGDGFSLLSMFGKATEEEKKTSETESNEKILISKSDKSNLNPFTYDSSDSENDEGQQSTEKPAAKSVKETKGESKEPAKIAVESFFIPKNDIRLKEGMAFFKYNKADKAENYEEIREKLKNLIKTKINKTKRQFKGKTTKRRK